MNPKYFGDSYDIVKRFFIGILRNSGYRVYVDPMFTGDWEGLEEQFHDFLGTTANSQYKQSSEKTALFIDPDTGIGRVSTSQHTTIKIIVNELARHELVFSFDQSFSRSKDSGIEMREKLNLLISNGASGFYYNSHARFLFASKRSAVIQSLRTNIQRSGLPDQRFIEP